MLRRCRPLLGTFVEVAADDDEAIEGAFAEIEVVHRLMSAHEPQSDVSRINRIAHFEPVEVHEWTARVLKRSLFWSKYSEGAFDVLRAGKSAVNRGLLPLHLDQPAPQADHWTWLEVQGALVRLLKPGCVDLGGIAKGFAVDRALDALRESGADRGFVNAGGDMAGFGQAWPAVIVEPGRREAVAEVSLEDEALATSALVGDSFHHLPSADERWISASVRAPSAMDADALTKVLLSKSAKVERCLELAGANGLRIAGDGSVEPVTFVAA